MFDFDNRSNRHTNTDNKCDYPISLLVANYQWLRGCLTGNGLVVSSSPIKGVLP